VPTAAGRDLHDAAVGRGEQHTDEDHLGFCPFLVRRAEKQDIRLGGWRHHAAAARS
jgi:hypothetical protein